VSVCYRQGGRESGVAVKRGFTVNTRTVMTLNLEYYLLLPSQSFAIVDMIICYSIHV